jgi:hypothetical protein
VRLYRGTLCVWISVVFGTLACAHVDPRVASEPDCRKYADAPGCLEIPRACLLGEGSQDHRGSERCVEANVIVALGEPVTSKIILPEHRFVIGLASGPRVEVLAAVKEYENQPRTYVCQTQGSSLSDAENAELFEMLRSEANRFDSSRLEIMECVSAKGPCRFCEFERSESSWRPIGKCG